jgi:hypothetical protein
MSPSKPHFAEFMLTTSEKASLLFVLLHIFDEKITYSAWKRCKHLFMSEGYNEQKNILIFIYIFYHAGFRDTTVAHI